MSLDRIISDAEEAAGRAVIERVQAGQLEPNRDLPIRHPETGAVMAHVPAPMAAGLRPIVRNGFVVSYYVDDNERGVTLYPFVAGTDVVGLVEASLGERWVPVFDEKGYAYGSVRIT